MHCHCAALPPPDTCLLLMRIMRVTMTGVSEEIIRRSRASTEEEDSSQEPVREAEDRVRAWPGTGPGLGRD